MVLLVLGVTKAALSFAWFGEAKPLQNQVSLYRLQLKRSFNSEAAPKQNQRFCYAQN